MRAGFVEPGRFYNCAFLFGQIKRSIQPVRESIWQKKRVIRREMVLTGRLSR